MRRLGLVAALLATALAGCVSVPDSGPVRQVEPRGAEIDFLVQVVPSGPEPGAGPEAIVRGWLTAMKAFPVSTEVARQYLTDEAAQTWSPERRTGIYTPFTVVAKDSGVVQLRSRQVARLSVRGAYRQTPAAAAERTVSLRLEQTGAGWRIVDPPDTLLISVQFFEEYFRPFNLYFLDSGGEALVADPVWLPLGDQLPTQLVQGLFAGPTPWLQGQAGTTLSTAAGAGVSAPLRSDGVADVQLGEQAANLSATQRTQLAAQLTWTLSQITGLAGLRMRVGGAKLDVPDADSVQTTDTWGQFDPSGPPARALLFGVRRGGLAAIEARSVATVNGWWGNGGAVLGEVSVERTLQRVAAVVGGNRLLAGPFNAVERADVRRWYESQAADGTLRDPQWDRTGQLWVLDTGGRSGSASVVVADKTDARPAPAGGLAQAGISAFAISPDGARLAALVHRWSGPYRGGEPSGRDRSPVLVIARVVRGADGRTVRRLDRAYAVPVRQSGLGDLASPTWVTPAEVGVLGRIGKQPPQVYRVAIDGSEVQGAALTGEALLGQVGADELTDAGVVNARTVIGTRSGRLYVLDSESEWSRLSAVGEIDHPRHPD
ncbi:LpqB family beta-propeller domain-containing protein [soil metagenome]